MSKVHGRTERTARLLKIQMLLWQNPQGLDVTEIAQRCSINKRTAYRDLKSIEYELGVPIWEKRGKRGVSDGYFLPPVNFTQAEAINIFLAVRLMQNYSPSHNPSIASTFMKLNTIVPIFLRKQIQDTIEYLEKQPRNERRINNFSKLTQAWLSQRRIKVIYQELYGEAPVEHIIEPYFIEPGVWNRSTYVIAYCHLKKSICTFKIDRIIGDVKIEKDTYQIPADFSIIDYLSSAWSIYADKVPETMKLRFSKRVSRAIMETKWHQSQVMELQNDGSLIMNLRVHNTGDFRFWVLGWGDDVEVLEPKMLRDQITSIARSIANIYERKQSKK